MITPALDKEWTVLSQREKSDFVLDAFEVTAPVVESVRDRFYVIASTLPKYRDEMEAGIRAKWPRAEIVPLSDCKLLVFLPVGLSEVEVER